MFCGVDTPLPRQVAPSGAKLNWAIDEDFAGFNRSLVAETCAEPYLERLGLSGLGVVRSYPPGAVVSWCETCKRNDESIDPTSGPAIRSANVAAMGRYDWIALVFAAFVVAFTCVGELNDIRVCSMAIAQAGEKLSPGWRFVLSLLGGVRRGIFLPALVIMVPVLVMCAPRSNVHSTTIPFSDINHFACGSPQVLMLSGAGTNGATP
eukprot:COSAG02_NODE_2698_length_8208_cov_10.377482_3_plen_207_part_00